MHRPVTGQAIRGCCRPSPSGPLSVPTDKACGSQLSCFFLSGWLYGVEGLHISCAGIVPGFAASRAAWLDMHGGLTDVQPQLNFPPDNVFNLDRPARDPNARRWAVNPSSASLTK